MCNRYRLTAKQAEVAATFGIRPPYEVDQTFPVGDIFPKGQKTPFHGAVIVQDGDDRRIELMEWGVPTQVPSKRDSAVKLTKYVTNVRNLSSSFWRSIGRGNAYGFLTTEPNAVVGPIHPKAMPVILHDNEYERWLTLPWDEVKDAVAPYPSQLMRVAASRSFDA